MNLLECLVGIALCTILLNPLLQTSAELLRKQIQYEKTQSLISEAERALELMGRAIRMAGYRHIKSASRNINSLDRHSAIQIQQQTGYRGSDTLLIRHELSDGLDFDCIGNALTSDRTKKDLAFQGFLVDRQAGVAKGKKVNGGSLICQSLDRQGRLQNTTLMNGVDKLQIEELASEVKSGQRAFRVRLEMTDGMGLQREFTRTFSTRNLL